MSSCADCCRAAAPRACQRHGAPAATFLCFSSTGGIFCRTSVLDGRKSEESIMLAVQQRQGSVILRPPPRARQQPQSALCWHVPLTEPLTQQLSTHPAAATRIRRRRGVAETVAAAAAWSAWTAPAAACCAAAAAACMGPRPVSITCKFCLCCSLKLSSCVLWSETRRQQPSRQWPACCCNPSPCWQHGEIFRCAWYLSPASTEL